MGLTRNIFHQKYDNSTHGLFRRSIAWSHLIYINYTPSHNVKKRSTFRTSQNQHLLKPPPESLQITSQISDVVELKEVELVAENFTEEYGGVWSRLKAKVEGIGGTDEAKDVATAKVHLII